MERQTKICQNCGKEFTIEPEDSAFYEKVKVPPPTFCPECRLQRRMVFKNERNFYKRQCDLCGEQIISVHHKNALYPVFCPSCWWSDKWEATTYGQDYDFSKPFFNQFYEIFKKSPKISLNIDYPRTINSKYINNTGPIKNCYLVIQGERDENCCYSYNIVQTNDSFDCFNALHVTESYGLIDCQRCNRAFFSVNCFDSVGIYFSKNLRNCMDCFGCINLRNKKYCIFNKPYSKQKYVQFIKDFNLGSDKEIGRQKEKIKKIFLSVPYRYMESAHNTNVSGNFIYNSKNVFNSFDIIGAENCKYCRQFTMPFVKDSYDYSDWGNNVSLVYDSINCGEFMSNIKFSFGAFGGINVNYCDTTISSDYVFGCISLKKRKYCILNKEYSKEEYQGLVPKIIEHMNKMPYTDKKGRIYKYGEFFPPELSPFAYNETIAQEYFPLTKEQALDQGYSWKEPEERNLQIDIKIEDLPDHIKDVKDDIVGKVIECSNAKSSQGIDPGKTYRGLTSGEFSNCTTAFKIISQELAFYRKMNLPLPRFCPNCRHYQRLKQRNPLKLWRRKCMCNGKTSGGQPSVKFQEGSPPEIYTNTVEHFHKDKACPQEFETTYALDRPEIVYCEACYKQEVN